MSLQIYLFCPRLNDFDRPNRGTATPTVSNCWRRNFLGSIPSRWLDLQPSAGSSSHPSDRARHPPGSTEAAGADGLRLRRTPSQRSASSALGRARRWWGWCGRAFPRACWHVRGLRRRASAPGQGRMVTRLAPPGAACDARAPSGIPLRASRPWTRGTRPRWPSLRTTSQAVERPRGIFTRFSS
jgi:hypothetical protein